MLDKDRVMKTGQWVAWVVISGLMMAGLSQPAWGEEGELATATFAGGCFWCMEKPFDYVDGVKSTISGYMGGTTPNPTYEQVTSGQSGHIEVVQIMYDPSEVGYSELLQVFWQNVDPLDDGGQFCDRGPSYQSQIFVHDEEQRELAEASKQGIEDINLFDQPIVTEIVDATDFYAAEDYHQDYYLRNSNRYKFYRYACGRDRRLNALWGDVNPEQLVQR